MRDAFGFIMGIVGILVSFFAALFIPISALQYFWEKDQCAKYAILSGHETFYSWSTPCYVKNSDGKWVTLDALTKNNAEIKVK